MYNFINDTHMQSLYYVAAAGKWWIGPTIGGSTRRAESNSAGICAESLENSDWFEFDGKHWNLSETAQVKCLDSIHCACQILDISGFRYRRNGNGNYIMNNSTFDGRKCFIEIRFAKIKENRNRIY